jgi:hypothetical protein
MLTVFMPESFIIQFDVAEPKLELGVDDKRDLFVYGTDTQSESHLYTV